MENNLENYSQYCFVVGATDVGKKRAANEDYLGKADTPNGRVVVVCDGMGGHVGGATASHIAVDTILDFLRENFRNDPREAIGEAIDAANQAILNHTRNHPELTGMGSTCVLLIVRNGKVYIGHVGDSRIYLVRSKTIHQLTVDHSTVQELVDAGAISKEQAEHHPRKNEITNALGIPNMKPATVRDEPISPKAGDVFLLCSDGLSNMVDDEHIAHIASNFDMTTQQRANTLVQRANDNGGLDNITCALVEFSAKPETVVKVPFWKKKAFVIGLVAAAVLICGFVAWQLFKNPKPKVDNTEEPVHKEDTIKSTENKIVELHKEKMDLGEISVHANQSELLTIRFENFYTQIDNIEGVQVNRQTLPEFIPDSVKWEEPLDLKFSLNKKKADLKLTNTLENMGKTKQKFSFTMQNESELYEFRFTVKVKIENSPERKPTSTPQNTDPVSEIVEVENVNDTIQVYVNKNDYCIILCSNENDVRGADHPIVKKDYAFLQADSECDWYKITNDNNYRCTIVVKDKNKIPSGGACVPIKVRSGEEGFIVLEIHNARNV